jgi:Coenzyme PQQ synthesis protein D (PqqD)
LNHRALRAHQPQPIRTLHSVKPPDHLITRTLDDGLIVAPLGGHRLFVMNGSARFIWEQRANGADDSNIPSLMADRYGIGIRQAQSDFRKTLRRWQAEGLAGPAGSRRHYKIGSIGFSVDYPDRDIEVAVTPILDHMELLHQNRLAVIMSVNSRSAPRQSKWCCASMESTCYGPMHSTI